MCSHWLRNSLALCVLFSATVAHADDAAAKAKAALALAKAQRERQATSTAAKPKPRAIVVEDCYEDLTLAKTVAATLNRPLVLWVGMSCREAPEVCDQLRADAVSCHVKTYKGDSTPRVVVPDPKGEEYRVLKSEINKDSSISIRLRMGLPVKGYIAGPEAKAAPVRVQPLPLAYAPLYPPPVQIAPVCLT